VEVEDLVILSGTFYYIKTLRNFLVTKQQSDIEMGENIVEIPCNLFVCEKIRDDFYQIFPECIKGGICIALE